MKNLGVPLPLDMVERFGVPPRENTTAKLQPAFEACAEYDNLLGTSTVLIMKRFVSLDERMGDLRIQVDPDPKRVTEAQYGNGGFDGWRKQAMCYANFNPNQAHYEGPILAGNLRGRFPPSIEKDLWHPKINNLDHLLLANLVPAHELAHLFFYSALLTWAEVKGGTPADAYREYRKQRLAEMRTLPFGTGTGIAFKYWAGNVGEFRDELIDHYGMDATDITTDNKDFRKLARRNVRLYRNVPSEAAADYLGWMVCKDVRVLSSGGC